MSKEQLAQWLAKLDEDVLRVAIMYAENYLKYGVDITEKWETATKQQWSLERAERDGYVKGMKSIVRCRDCKHHGRLSCVVCRNEIFETADNWYCACGERKTDNG